MKKILSFVLLLSLSACGGGGSSDGAGQAVNNDVSFCIAAVSRTTGGSNGVPSLSVIDYTNTCDFAVNFGSGIAGLTINIVQLAPGAVDTSVIQLRFVACRPPSQPFLDRDGSTAGVYSCT